MAREDRPLDDRRGARPVLALPLAACTPERPEASDAAAALADAIAAGDVSALEFRNGAAKDVQGHLEAVLEPLAPYERTVEVESVDVDEEGDDAGDRATATLAYRWEVGGDQAWEYTTTAELTFAEPAEGEDGPGAWDVVWEPDVLVPELGQGGRLAVSRVPAVRAGILGADGVPIVQDRPSSGSASTRRAWARPSGTARPGRSRASSAWTRRSTRSGSRAPARRRSSRPSPSARRTPRASTSTRRAASRASR